MILSKVRRHWGIKTQTLSLSNSCYEPRQVKVQKVFRFDSNFANRRAAFSLLTPQSNPITQITRDLVHAME